ncbi:MAG: glycoside hydrolase family 3 N-terminal domain-containing protein [Bacteroidota bacterium]
MKKKIILILIIAFVLPIQAQKNPFTTKDSIAQEKWVNNIISKMTLDEKIGQLFMVSISSNSDKKNKDYIEKLITNSHVGNLVLMWGTPEAQATLVNRYQGVSKVPLLIAIDAEWGLDMRLERTFRFPYNMPLGAIRDNRLIEKFGEHSARHLKRLGIHINFAPVVDINTNPKNPIIGNRSFGEDKYNVTQKSISYTKGLQSENVMACAKHFPGHGDTSKDSHKTLPSVDFTAERINSVELYPYKKLFKAGVGSIMTAHLSIPSLESDPDVPSSLSYDVVTKLAKEKLQFKGLIFTDALNMKGASNFAKPGAVDLKAFLAGNDILLFPEDVPSAVKMIKDAFNKRKFTEDRLDHSVRKILKAKYWAGLNNYKPVALENLGQDLNTIEDELLNRELVENSITLIKNKGNILPLKNLDKNKIAYVKLGKYENKTFTGRLNDYTKVDIVGGKNLAEVLQKLKKYKTVIVGFHTKGSSPITSNKFTNEELHWLQEISRNNKVILDVFASPYSLLQIKSFVNIEAIMISYQNIPVFQDISAQMIFGAKDIKGKLPVNIGDKFEHGFGLHIANIDRLGYTIPEAVGLDREKLNKIDSVAQVVMDSAMAPGMQVLVARHGQVVFRKNYGHYTYDLKKKVNNQSIYDLASVTKILGGLPMIMKAEEEGKFTLETTLGEIMPVLKDSNKDTLTVKEVLSHYGKLHPYIVFYKEVIDSITKEPLDEFLHHSPSSSYNVKVADKLYLRSDYEKVLFKQIAEVPQREELEYRYSGLPFYLFKDYVEKQYGKPMDEMDDIYFYSPLGATTLTYNPLKKFPKGQIVPTELDTVFRHQLLHGTVHDEGAAMLGGVSGNAGLFGNSNDVAKIMQMYLQNGYYGGKTYLKRETLNKFNFRYYEDEGVRRGLGFDKPQLNDAMVTCGCISFKSFGHSGYTGTYTFADPETEIVYVFLSNRVYPTRDNRKLFENDIRPNIQKLIQDAIIE